MITQGIFGILGVLALGVCCVCVLLAFLAATGELDADDWIGKVVGTVVNLALAALFGFGALALWSEAGWTPVLKTLFVP